MAIRVQIIVLLTGFLMWCGIFLVTRDVYRTGHAYGIIPNLHIKERLSNIF
ncbi:hypothetical protein [Rhizobium rhizoryzae]|uniref:Uncharacterized protein n=1 Tax=Rhizobium rhizoryzae TaxID=451876 RepID=A0A7W6PSW0_9HYPH|nr:hypothetical protein [Rhizobium rhizoryzae]MBB4145963.1 hypothetical protein [Rhizobium rhizoryzae]